MKRESKITDVILAMFLILTVFGCAKVAPVDSGELSQDELGARWAAATGNGAPSGAHYNLNIIGKQKGSCSGDSGGNVIFVPLSGSAKINLFEGPFDVLEKCALNGPAEFQLPNPDPTNSGYTTYSVYVRGLGKPGGSSIMTPCGTDAVTGEVVCSTLNVVTTRTSGKQTFSNVSKELLYVYVYLDGVLTRIPLFDSRLEDYYWAYDNNGLKLLQMRFYEISTNVN